MKTRIERLRQLLAEQDLPALLVTQPDNRRYLSGFTGSAGILIVTADKALLATDFRYYQQVKEQTRNWDLVPVTGAGYQTLSETIAELGLRRIAFESQDVTVAMLEQWREAMPGVEWVAKAGLVEQLRQIKEPQEIAFIVEAVRIADEALGHVMEWIEPEMTERQVAWELEVYMRTHGAENVGFSTIVGVGANSALSHAIPGDRVIRPNMPIVIDMGALYQGYRSDMTRSFCLGHADEVYLERWNIVLQAQLAAERGIKAGMSGLAADKLARDVIYGAGYTEHFGHGLGHSLGLAIHENPRAAMTSNDILPAGCTLTIEPGLYVPGWGGIRIEDTTVVEEQGLRILTQTAKVPVVRPGLA